MRLKHDGQQKWFHPCIYGFVVSASFLFGVANTRTDGQAREILKLLSFSILCENEKGPGVGSYLFGSALGLQCRHCFGDLNGLMRRASVEALARPFEGSVKTRTPPVLIHASDENVKVVNAIVPCDQTKATWLTCVGLAFSLSTDFSEFHYVLSFELLFDDRWFDHWCVST